MPTEEKPVISAQSLAQNLASLFLTMSNQVRLHVCLCLTERTFMQVGVLFGFRVVAQAWHALLLQRLLRLSYLLPMVVISTAHVLV